MKNARVQECRVTVRELGGDIWLLGPPTTAGMFFCTVMKPWSPPSRRDTSTADPAQIQVRSTATGELLAILSPERDGGGGDAKGQVCTDMCTIPNRSELVTAHRDGCARVWVLTADGGVPTHAKTLALTESTGSLKVFVGGGDQDVLCVVSPDEWSMTSTAVPGTNGTPQWDGCTVRNCVACGVFNVKSSSKCGGCKAVNFCDSKCLKRGWKAHKPKCVAASKGGD
jgi:hypothetical protein